MSHASRGWPATDPRLRVESTPTYSVFCTGPPPSQASHGAGSSNGQTAPQARQSSSRSATAATTQHAGGAGCWASVPGGVAAVATEGGEVGVVCVDVVCPYTRALVVEGLERRRGAWRVTRNSAEATLHWGDYEMIDWERVVSGQLRASSYCVRKGLSRKAQLSRYSNKYASKRPGTPLKAALPRTLVIDTWEAFDDEMTFNLGGDIAAFGADLGVRQSVSLATRLDWCLSEAREWIEEGDADQDGHGGRRRWILKPSTLNKGAALALGDDFETLRDAIHGSPDIREWVLQEYVERPLLAEGRKFHLRAYAMAVGCIQVYLYDTVLLLRAAKKYPLPGSGGSGDGAFVDEDPLAHITNTARQAEDRTFKEEDNVWVLDDLVGELESQGLSPEDARSKVDKVMTDVRTLTTELFRAFRGEFAVFSPLPGCFEHFGLDFMVDEDFHVWLLEANPGPDFKQTGSRLKHVIGGLIEGSMRICLDGAADPFPAAAASDKANGGGGAATGVKMAGGAAGGREGGGTNFSLVLEEQWRGTGSTPSMKMV